jgi:hypothetical protein
MTLDGAAKQLEQPQPQQPVGWQRLCDVWGTVQR